VADYGTPMILTIIHPGFNADDWDHKNNLAISCITASSKKNPAGFYDLYVGTGEFIGADFPEFIGPQKEDRGCRKWYL